jgi:ribosomal protein S18 acetylase RimI-like enzyme
MKILFKDKLDEQFLINDFNNYGRNLISLYNKHKHYKIRYLFMIDGKTIHSRMVIFIRNYNNSLIGGIGLLKLSNSTEIFYEMVKKAENWFIKEGIKQYYIPLDFNTWYKYRIISNHFNNPVFTLEEINEKYITDILNSYNYNSRNIFYSYLIDKPYKVIDATENFANYGISKNIRIVEYDAYKMNSLFLRNLFEISKNVFSDALLYEDINYKEFKNIYEPFLSKVHGSNLLLAIIQNNIVGYIFSVNDYYKKNRLIIKTIAVKKKYSNYGVGSLLTYKLYKESVKIGVKEFIHAYMKENISTKRFSESFGKIYREYTLYGKRF